ncbi:hypothetical protein [Gemmatimonas sp.]
MPDRSSLASLRFAGASIIGVASVLGASARLAMAQAVDSTRARADSAKAPAVSVVPVGASNTRSRFTPPLTPRRAFLYSAVLPGLGQSRLDRGSSGALFAAVELSALVMVRRSAADLREARRFRNDTLYTSFTVGADGKLTPVTPIPGRNDADLVRTRRLHVEDWLAVIAFNHLFAGADAFVAAQLWDIPVRLTAAPSANGPLFVATIRF